MENTEVDENIRNAQHVVTWKTARGSIKKRMLFVLAVSVTALAGGCQEAAGADGGTGADTQAGVESVTETMWTDSESDAQEVDAAHTSQTEESAEPEEDAEALQDQGSETDEKEPPEGWELILASEDWGLSFGESGTQPTGNAAPEDLYWYDAYYVGSDKEKNIYLTFDCGYENGNTEPILDALDKHDAPAAFFVVGHFLETAPDLVKRMTAEGHIVGNHTYHHPDMSAISDKEDFQRELGSVEELFRDITGKELSNYYRPPQGKCNVNNLKMADELGYHTMFWSLAYVDWDVEDQPGHEEALDKLTSRVHPGAVVLLHNTSSTNGEILDELLTKWEEMGYSFRPLTELVDERKQDGE